MHRQVKRLWAYRIEMGGFCRAMADAVGISVQSRGREQRMIDFHGDVESPKVHNSIRG